MLKPISTAEWTPLDLIGWSRCAFGRRVMLESDGGSLATNFKPGAVPDELYLRLNVEGRMLVRLRCNGAELFSDLVSNDELDCFADLRPFAQSPTGARLDLHLIPATFGTARVPEAVDLLGASSTPEPKDRKEPAAVKQLA